MRISLSNSLSIAIRVLIIVVCSLNFTQIQAQTDLSQTSLTPTEGANAWLAKLASAKNNLNYQISFVVMKPGIEAQPFVWRHGISPDGVELEQLDELNGPGREVIRIGNKVSYFESDRPPYSLASGYINGPLPNVLLADPLSLTDAYQFALVGRSRVSGKVAHQIRVVSKDKNRYRFNLWLDQKTGLPLKINMVDLEGQTIEQIQVTDLSVTEEPDPYLIKLLSTSLPDIVQLPPKAEIEQRWQLDFLPEGMKQINHDVRRLPVEGGLVEYVMLSDGLVDVSVYLQQAFSNAAQNEILGRIGSEIYLTRQQGNVLVTVIGKLPAKTANAIASSLTRTIP